MTVIMNKPERVSVSTEDLERVEAFHLRVMEAKVRLADFMSLIQQEALAEKTSDVEAASAAFQDAISECAKKYDVPDGDDDFIWELSRDDCCFIRRDIPPEMLKEVKASSLEETVKAD